MEVPAFRLIQAAWLQSYDEGSSWRKAMDDRSVVREDAVTIVPGVRFRIALVLALLADALQLALIPLFVEGAESPAADVVDFAMAAMLFFLLGWHWEFLPSFFGKLVPGVDLVPLWTLAVANVYRKSKRQMVERGGA